MEDCAAIKHCATRVPWRLSSYGFGVFTLVVQVCFRAWEFLYAAGIAKNQCATDL